MFTVKTRVFGKAADGRTVLLYTRGMTITDEAAKDAGLLAGAPKPKKPAKGLKITKPEADDTPKPSKPLANMNLGELRAICDDEEIDPADANTRAEFRDKIEEGRAAAGDED